MGTLNQNSRYEAGRNLIRCHPYPNKTNMDHCRSCVLSEFAVFGLFPLSRLQVILLFFICAHYPEGFI